MSKNGHKQFAKIGPTNRSVQTYLKLYTIEIILKQVPHSRGLSVNIHLDFVSVHIHPQSPRLRHIIANYLAFPQLKEISFKMTITLGGGVNINCNYYTIIFSKALCLFFCPIPSPYQDSHMQIVCGNPASS